MRLRLSLVLSLLTSTAALADEPIRGVVELFTSQGCSSCPPADALFEELSRQPGLAVLSLPVDYWDRLGWKDTYGSPAHSARQRGYAAARGDRAVYTPQAVVNGAAHMNGADRGEIADNVQNLRSSLAVGVRVRQQNGELHIDVGAAPAATRPAALVVMPYLAHREVEIRRGENASRRIAYTNIVRRIDVAGTWRGTAGTFTYPLREADGADGVVVLLQTGTREAPGPIVGAAQMTLAK